jgi:hypothetical protein
MEILINKTAFQVLICIKDNKHYVYKKGENHDLTEDDYKLIKCFQVKKSGEPDFSKEIEIYGKDLIRED